MTNISKPDKIVAYRRDLKITNTAMLPRGTGAKYLLALVVDDVFVAHSWKRKAPKIIPAGYVLIEFGQ